MRLAALALAAVAFFSIANTASAQSSQDGRQRRGQDPNEQQEERNGPRTPRIAPLRNQANAGPCPYVKILYDAARYVELADNRPALANVGFTGEIEGVTSGCSYQGDEPITVQLDLLFNLGKGARATGDQRSYRYWIAVTERNSAVLAKEYFDLPVDFAGAATASVPAQETVVIPRKDASVSGNNFEVLVGFDITPEMAEFNRNGSRFRVNAGSVPTAPASAATPPAQ